MAVLFERESQVVILSVAYILFIYYLFTRPSLQKHIWRKLLLLFSGKLIIPPITDTLLVASNSSMFALHIKSKASSALGPLLHSKCRLSFIDCENGTFNLSQQATLSPVIISLTGIFASHLLYLSRVF
ncbi:hypothetical protein BDQ17DRAFT_349800 [Cyathus striatus]|nr:hypothetical protein BDQ17DRAFT_349800 [Cyathus striatus]